MKSCITISLVRSLNGGPWVLWDNIETSLRIAAEKGFDGVELFTSGPSIDSVKPLSHLLQQNNLSLAAVGTGAGKVLHGLTLTDADPSIREKLRILSKGLLILVLKIGLHLYLARCKVHSQMICRVKPL